MLGLSFSSKLDWGSYIISIAKTASKKIGALIRSMKFLSRAVALYLYTSTILLCMEYCCHIWVGARSCYWELLDKLQKWTCRIVVASLFLSLETLVHHQNVGSFSLFYRYYFGRCYLNWPNWFHFLILKVGLLVILIDCMIFLSPCLDVLQGCLCQNFPSSHRLTLIFSLPIECFFSTYDLNGFKCGINRHLLTAGFLYRDFLYVLTFLCFFFL